MQLGKETLTKYIGDFLKSQSVCILATVGGSEYTKFPLPRATPTHYYSDDELKLYILSDDNTSKLTNLQINPNISVCVCDYRSYNPNDRQFSNCKAVQITGWAKILDEHSDEKDRGACY